jgi:hypothetical protein
MRFYPAKEKKEKGDNPGAKTLAVTRVVALVLAFLSVFVFFLKLLFF